MSQEEMILFYLIIMTRKALTLKDPYWLRQPYESKAAYEAFTLYRDMGSKRSLRAVGEKLNKSFTLMGRWSGIWKWPKRADAWDDHIDYEATQAAFNEVIEMKKRHINIATALQVKGFQDFDKINPEDLKAAERLAFILEGVKLERISRGEATEIQETVASKEPHKVVFEIINTSKKEEDK
jgi:hypothetical protein